MLRIFKSQLHYILRLEGKSIRATVIHLNLSQNVWVFFGQNVKHAVGLRRENRFNKLTSVFHASVLLLIINFVITLSK